MFEWLLGKKKVIVYMTDEQLANARNVIDNLMEENNLEYSNPDNLVEPRVESAAGLWYWMVTNN